MVFSQVSDVIGISVRRIAKKSPLKRICGSGKFCACAAGKREIRKAGMKAELFFVQIQSSLLENKNEEMYSKERQMKGQ